jgi:hypothetical protein
MKTIALVFGAVFMRFLIVSPFMLLFWWLRQSARKARPRESGTSIDFFLAPRMKVLIEIVVVSLATFSALVALETLRKGEGLYAALIPLSVLIAILLATPRSVSTDPEGVHQHRWFRKDRVIRWNEVAWVRRGRNTGATYVKSRNGGRPVSFSPLLIGQRSFERELRNYARDLELDE